MGPLQRLKLFPDFNLIVIDKTLAFVGYITPYIFYKMIQMLRLEEHNKTGFQFSHILKMFLCTNINN